MKRRRPENDGTPDEEKLDDADDSENDRSTTEVDEDDEKYVAKQLIESIDLLPWLPVVDVAKLVGAYAKPLEFVLMKFATPAEVRGNRFGDEQFSAAWVQWTGNERALTRFKTTLEDHEDRQDDKPELDIQDRVDEHHTQQTRGAIVVKTVFGRFKQTGNSIPQDFFDEDPFDKIDKMFLSAAVSNAITSALHNIDLPEIN